jgi:transposase
MTLRQICQDPTVETVYALTQEFAMMVRQRIAAMLDPWLTACQDSGVTNLQTFADGVKRDYDAIRGSLETNWSNGQTERAKSIGLRC